MRRCAFLARCIYTGKICSRALSTFARVCVGVQMSREYVEAFGIDLGRGFYEESVIGMWSLEEGMRRQSGPKVNPVAIFELCEEWEFFVLRGFDYC